VLDAFCNAFNARDLDRLAALMLDTATAEIVGINTEYGPEAAKKGSFWGAFQPLGWNDQLNCGIESRLLQGYRPAPPRAEVRSHRGESIVLFWYPQDGGEAVRDVGRVETEGEIASRAGATTSSRPRSSRRSAASSAFRSEPMATDTGKRAEDPQ